MVGLSRLLLFLFLGFSASIACAFNINIDVNGYAGSYKVNSVTYTGNQTINLAAGSYTFEHHPGSIGFTVDGSGNVTSLQTASATASGSTLTLITTVVQFDPQDYTYNYSIYGHSNISGVQNVTLITNTQHRLRNGLTAMITDFEVDGSGAITNVSHPNYIITSNAKITLKTAHVIIDPAKYTGTYKFSNVLYSGVNKVIMLVGAYDRIWLGSNGTIAHVVVDHELTITNVAQTNLILEKGKITFKTQPFTFYPGRFEGGYKLIGYEGTPKFGVHTFDIIPEATNRVDHRTGATIANFTINSSGYVTWNDGQSIRYERRAIYFKNQRVHIAKPTGFSGSWRVYYINEFTNQDVDLFLIPYTNFVLYSGSTGTTVHNFQVTDCASDVTVTTPAGDYTVSCISMDRVNLLDINPDVYTDIKSDFVLQYINRKYSATVGDFTLTHNGNTVPVFGGNFTEFLFKIPGLLQNGRNHVQFSGKDENTSTFTRNYIIWAGQNVVEVDTGSTSLNYDVTLNVIHTISGTDYYFGETKTTQNGKAYFLNVPNLYVWVSTTRNYVEQVGRFIDGDTQILLPQ